MQQTEEDASIETFKKEKSRNADYWTDKCEKEVPASIQSDERLSVKDKLIAAYLLKRQRETKPGYPLFATHAAMIHTIAYHFKHEHEGMGEAVVKKSTRVLRVYGYLVKWCSPKEFKQRFNLNRGIGCYKFVDRRMN
jgi:hypothetical protein